VRAEMLIAVESGEPRALHNMGVVERSDGNYDEAREWFRRAIEAGWEESLLDLAWLEDGRSDPRVAAGEREPDLDAAFELYARAAVAGRICAYGYLAQIAVERGDPATAEELLERGVAAGVGRFAVEDVEAIDAAGPGDLRMPTRAERESYGAGDGVKLIWSGEAGIERMWAQILIARDGRYLGYLDNDPVRLPLEAGTPVAFGPEHILQGPPTAEELAAAAERVADGRPAVIDVPAGVSEAAYEEIRDAAEAGDGEAIWRMVGFSAQRGDDEGRRHWLERGAAVDDARALDLLGDELEEEGDLEGAQRNWRRAAELGNRYAMLSLAGAAFEADDEAAAERWARAAAELGLPPAMMLLAVILLERDPAEARGHLEAAAAEDFPPAITLLGSMLKEDGDLEGARALFERARDLDDPAAVRELAVLDLGSGGEDPARTNQERARRRFGG